MERALLNEKDVTTDWIDIIFDNVHCIESDRQAVGFVNDYPVYVAWDDNCMVWKAIMGGDSVLNEIESRLSEFEDEESGLFSKRKKIGDLILQQFYFKED